MEVDDRDREASGSGWQRRRVCDAGLELGWGWRCRVGTLEDGEKGWTEDVHPSGEDDQVGHRLHDSSSHFLVIVFP